MHITNRQKLQALAVTVAAGVLLWDRLSGPDKPVVAPADLLLRSTAQAAPHHDDANTATRSSIGERLAEIATQQAIDPEKAGSAFTLDPGWDGETSKPASNVDKTDNKLSAASDFAAKHKLDAVLRHSHGGYAIVNGQGIFVGQKRDGFQLVSVTNNSAVFLKGSSRVELKIIDAIDPSEGGSSVMRTTEASAPTDDAGAR